MISIYNGTPGSGKSMHVAQDISDIIRYQDKYIVTNIPINIELFPEKKRHKYFYLKNSDLTPAKLKEISNLYFESHKGKIREGRIKVIIDEAQLLFNARTWNAPDRKEWNEFFTLHRHLGIDFILVCQFDQMLDKQVRYLIEYQYIHRKLTNFGWKGILLFILSLGRRFSTVKYWYPIHEKLGISLLYCKRNLFKIYDTFMLFEDEDN